MGVGSRAKRRDLYPPPALLKGARVKAEIALVKGKKLHDKRDTLREKDLKREADRAMRDRKR